MSAGPGPILLIEPDAVQVAVLEQVLRQAGHGDVQVADPDAVLEAVASAKPRLVLLDLELSGSDGVDVLATLAPWVQAEPPLPVIVIAPAAAADARRRARGRRARLSCQAA